MMRTSGVSSMVAACVALGVAATVSQPPRASLGVRVETIAPADVASSGIPALRGVLVTMIEPTGPAKQAGMNSGDIITAIGGRPVPDVRAFDAILEAHMAGDVVVVDAVRPGDEKPFPRKSFRVRLTDGAAATPRDVAPPTAQLPQPAPASSSPTGSAPKPGAFRTIEDVGAVSAVPKDAPNCKAYAPQDWNVAGSRPQGDAMDLVSGDRSMFASWGIRGVNRAMEMYYGATYGDPETSTRAVIVAVLQTMGSADARYTGAPQQLGAGFIARTFESSSHKGIVVYRVYPPPPGLAPGSYIISLRIAGAERRKWDTDGQRIATGVVVSIACTTMLQAPTDTKIDLPKPGDPPSMRRRASGETGALAGYNAQLGTQWVHSPTTGQSYLVDATAGHTNGPDGPGYYRKAGNSYEKLVAGF